MFSISTVVGGVVEERALILLLLLSPLPDSLDAAPPPPLLASLLALGRRLFAALNILLQCFHFMLVLCCRVVPCAMSMSSRPLLPTLISPYRELFDD